MHHEVEMFCFKDRVSCPMRVLPYVHRFLYFRLRGGGYSASVSLTSLVQSLAVSELNVLKNMLELYLGYKVCMCVCVLVCVCVYI